MTFSTPTSTRHAGGHLFTDHLLERAGKLGIGAWNLRFALRGRAGRVDHQLEAIREAMSRIEGSTVNVNSYTPGRWSAW